MSQMTTPADLFVHELQDVYFAERTLTKVLPKLADEVNDEELTEAFRHHLDETRQHVANGHPETRDRRADRPRFGASCIGQVALARAILIAGHLVVVLPEVGRGVPKVDHQAARLERGEQWPAGERLRVRCRREQWGGAEEREEGDQRRA